MLKFVFFFFFFYIYDHTEFSRPRCRMCARLRLLCFLFLFHLILRLIVPRDLALLSKALRGSTNWVIVGVCSSLSCLCDSKDLQCWSNWVCVVFSSSSCLCDSWALWGLAYCLCVGCVFVVAVPVILLSIKLLGLILQAPDGFDRARNWSWYWAIWE